jgi:hypothetical protein
MQNNSITKNRMEDKNKKRDKKKVKKMKVDSAGVKELRKIIRDKG